MNVLYSSTNTLPRSHIKYKVLKMIDRINEGTQWIKYESKVCRAVLGLTQIQLADVLEKSLDVVKRIESKTTKPKEESLNRIHEVFNSLGVQCSININKTETVTGTTKIKLNDGLVSAINKGNYRSYVRGRRESFDQESQ